MHEEETEFENLDCMEYITVAWKRRWQIVIPTVVVAVLAAAVSFLLPKVWEVDTIIIPSKFMTQSQTGEFKIVLVAEPKQIAGQITEGSYDSIIAAEVHIPARISRYQSRKSSRYQPRPSFRPGERSPKGKTDSGFALSSI